MKRSDFDLDFRHGKQAEGWVELLIRTLEVKRDRQWAKTGNIYIETESRNSGVWEPSGLAATKAGHFGIVIGSNECPACVVVPTSVLGTALMGGEPRTCDLEPNPTRGRLVRLSDIFLALRAAARVGT